MRPYLIHHRRGHDGDSDRKEVETEPADVHEKGYKAKPKERESGTRHDLEVAGVAAGTADL